MTDSSPATDDGGPARMRLEPKTVHEDDGGYALDCPECGSRVTLVQIVEEGRCDGYLTGEKSEGVDEEGQQLKEPGCTAELSLDLVWE